MWGGSSWRAFGALALATFAAVGTWAAAASAETRDPLADMRATVLENGLTVLTLEDPTTPVVSFQVWVDVGSGDEARWTGIAHLFEHMMFRGSKNLGEEEHARLVNERGGRNNAFTSRDVTVYFEDIPAEHLPVVVALEAERFNHLIIDADSLASERQVVISERRFRSEDDPGGRAFEQLMALTFSAHPYRIPTVGWMSDLERMTVEACREFFETYYAPNNLVIAIAGDIDTDETLRLVREGFGGLAPAAEIPRNPQQEPPQQGVRRATVHFDVQAPLLMMAWHAPPTGHEDAEALDVLSNVLSGGRASRLHRRLVRDEAIALGASGVYWELQRAGVFYATVQLRPGESADRAEALFVEELARLRAAPPSDAELERARRALEVMLSVGQGSAHALASRMGREWTSFGRVRPLAERLEKVRAVTAEDVQRVAQRYLDPLRRNVVKVVPHPVEDMSAAEDAPRGEVP